MIRMIPLGRTVLKLLPSKDQTLLVRRYPFVILDHFLDLDNRIIPFDIESKSSPTKRPNEDLHRMIGSNFQDRRRVTRRHVFHQFLDCMACSVRSRPWGRLKFDPITNVEASLSGVIEHVDFSTVI